ncbi:hypothetical protein QJS10_CPB17g02471 [Acorus calamus]|uniref:Uncharacterized protein n=1 Tax=Acorus calamus TaxID=4465 RepID=A0AAV9CVI2_ACOCL|nr:hypothetical protein QJS10_CPB17g02471 [Acorus calamus]
MEQQSHSEKQHWQLTEKLKGKEEMCMVLHQKVKDLENRFKEQQNSEFLSLQQKVRELEMKLVEHQRIELVGEQKVRELENKLREREVQLETMALSHSIDPLRVATPQHASSCKNEEESMNECDPHVLRSSNSINRPPAHNMPGLLKGGWTLPLRQGGKDLTEVSWRTILPHQLLRLSRNPHTRMS